MRTQTTTTETLSKKISGFRPDIEGLRAIAVLSVLVYHLSSSWLPGGFAGVDIFFVISGFLITSHLVKEWEKNQRISLSRFYARRMIRLLPAATLALIGTLVATILFMPRYLWQQVGTDVAASAAYIVNWVFAARSVDYLAEDSAPSPVQHFWSLAVEEQYYLIWPLLIILVATALKVRKKSEAVRSGLIVAASVVICLSFGAALLANWRGDATSYFATTARLWELSVGAISAIALPYLSRWVQGVAAEILFGAGLALIIISLIVIDGEDAWPGPLTCLPVLGAALIVGFGSRASVLGRVLHLKPLVWVGGISYSLYLWHWPVIIISGYVVDPDNFVTKIAVVVVSFVAAYGSVKLFENPIRFSAWAKARSRNGLTLGLMMGALVVVAGLLVSSFAGASSLRAPSGAVPKGATALGEDLNKVNLEAAAAQPDWVLPAPVDAEDDVPQLYADDCQQQQTSADVLSCSYGDVKSAKIIAIVGDSKANQWLPALDEIGLREGFRVTVMTKSACSFSDAPAELGGKPYPSCDQWNKNVDVELEKLQPEVVFTSMVNSRAHVKGGVEEAQQAMMNGLVSKLKRVANVTDHLVVVGDTPHPPRPEYQCVAEHSDDIAPCVFKLEPATAESAIEVQKEAVQAAGGDIIHIEDPSSNTDSRIALLDMTASICPEELAAACPAVIGNAMVYRQGSHLTATYVRSLETWLERGLRSSGVTL